MDLAELRTLIQVEINKEKCIALDVLEQYDSRLLLIRLEPLIPSSINCLFGGTRRRRVKKGRCIRDCMIRYGYKLGNIGFTDSAFDFGGGFVDNEDNIRFLVKRSFVKDRFGVAC
jgi:hypothetical protein